MHPNTLPMRISTIDTGYFKLDGGAMFGVVPQQLWKQLNPPDANNMCTWAMRCLLVQANGRNILIDTGIGDKQDDKFRRHFEPHGEASLLQSLAQKGLRPEDISDVLLTHLHFDHAGGACRREADGRIVPTFPKATYWASERHWQWAMLPNAREQASFLQENFLPLQEAGCLRWVEAGHGEVAWLEGIRLRYLYGHTEAMLMPLIPTPEGRTWAYCADLIPSSFHIGMPYVMSYDVRPLDTLREKAQLLEQALAEEWALIFEHDPACAAATLRRDAKGRIGLGEALAL